MTPARIPGCFAGVLAASGAALALAGSAEALAHEPPLQSHPLARVHEIATALGSCWRPPHDDDQVTVRVSFTRDGAVIGEPRIVYARSSSDSSEDAALATSMTAAIRACTPLRFSARLGAAIAGRVLAIRFVGPSHATIIDQP
jgi:hypothetical protein